jgi:hypothetical protein
MIILGRGLWRKVKGTQLGSHILKSVVLGTTRLDLLFLPLLKFGKLDSHKISFI